MQALPTLAEVSAALLGFATLVVVFRRRDSGQWHKADADRYFGMLFNAGGAVFFSMFPLVLAEFEIESARIWSTTSGLLAVCTAFQTVAALRLERSRIQAWEVAYLGVLGSASTIAQILNLTGALWEPAAGPYVAGVSWHALQSLLLFLRLVAPGASDIAES